MFQSNSGIAKVRVAIIVSSIIVAATVVAYYFTTLSSPSPPSSPTSVENVGGKYNVTLSWGEKYGEVEYMDEVGMHSRIFLVKMRSGLDWIKANTPENATFLCWWDNGHMLKGYAERNTVVMNPSIKIL